jgi:electron transport complex protein RnfD
VIPPGVPLWIPFIGSIFAILIVKEAFGGIGQNIFNPALASRAFLVASWPTLLTTWRLIDGTTGATPLGILKMEGIQAARLSASYLDMFLGRIGGSLGETSVLALLIGAGFLFYKKVITSHIPATYIGTVALMALIFRQDVLFHLLGGGLIIGAFFMATDYTTSPLTKTGRYIFGFGCGLLTIIIRLWGGYPEGVCYSIIIMNMFVPIIDRHTKPKPSGYVKPTKQEENS